MKKIVLLLTFLAILISCKKDIKKNENSANISTEEILETPKISLKDFDIEAATYINKEVQINGIVDHVCKHGGKKILLVSDEGQVHIYANERFDEALKGSEIDVIGVVAEERIDEATCLRMDEDNIKSHSEGVSNKEQFETKKKHIQQYRNQMKTSKKDHISFYSLNYVSHTVVE